MKSRLFEGKKVLIFGLGILGGGVQAVKWFYKNGAKIVITDKKTKKELQPSLLKLKNIKARYILGKHRFKDIDSVDIVYFNPGVSYKSEWVKYAREKNKEIVNDCYLFFKYAKGDIISITGTRGKTTTTTWTYELLKKILKFPILLGGNQPEKSLFKILNKTKEKTVSVLELSSFQLEFYEKALKSPKIAIITNIYNDHLNRYSNFEEYASVKARIFQNQTENDYLILNLDNEWTKFFLSLKPQSQVYFVSLNKKPKQGIYIKDEKIFINDILSNLRKEYEEYELFSVKKFKEIYGNHNLYNLLFAILAIYLYLKSKNIKNPQNKIKKLKNFVLNLKTPEFRQEIIYKSKNLIIVNDSCSTSPEATINAIDRFKKYKNLILITGGTDKNLDFKDLAKKIKKEIKPENLILLNGSATKKLIKELKKINYHLKKENIFEDLKEIASNINLLKNPHSSAILFSPASASFEKFKNEFDRGKKFNRIVRRLIK